VPADEALDGAVAEHERGGARLDARRTAGAHDGRLHVRHALGSERRGAARETAFV
jgi:hypothetical protein